MKRLLNWVKECATSKVGGYRLSANCQPTLDPRSPDSQASENAKNFGRGDWIRTSDPLRPRQVRYQAALRPDMNRLDSTAFSPPVQAMSQTSPRSAGCLRTSASSGLRQKRINCELQRLPLAF